MPKMKCVSRYANPPRNWYFRPGDVFEVTQEERRYLMNDAPGVFEDYAPEVKEIEEPAEDKAVKSPPSSKAARQRSK